MHVVLIQFGGTDVRNSLLHKGEGSFMLVLKVLELHNKHIRSLCACATLHVAFWWFIDFNAHNQPKVIWQIKIKGRAYLSRLWRQLCIWHSDDKCRSYKTEACKGQPGTFIERESHPCLPQMKGQAVKSSSPMRTARTMLWGDFGYHGVFVNDFKSCFPKSAF